MEHGSKAMPETRWRGERFAMIEFVRDDSPDQFRDDAATFVNCWKRHGPTGWNDLTSIKGPPRGMILTPSPQVNLGSPSGGRL